MCYTTDTHWFSCTKVWHLQICAITFYMCIYFSFFPAMLWHYISGVHIHMDIRDGCAFHNNGNTQKKFNALCCYEKKTNKKLRMAYYVQKNDPVISIFQFFVIRIVFCLKIKSSIRNPFDWHVNSNGFRSQSNFYWNERNEYAISSNDRKISFKKKIT